MNFQKKMADMIPSEITDGVSINSLLTTTQPPEFILKILIIQHRENVHLALDDYVKQKSLGIQPDLSRLKARLMSLFMQIRCNLKEYYTKESTKSKEDIAKEPDKFSEMEKDIIGSKEYERLYEICCAIEDYLYDKKLIKFDNSRKYDNTRVTIEDHEKHL